MSAFKIPATEFPASTGFEGEFDEFRELWCETVRQHWRKMTDPSRPLDDPQPLYVLVREEVVTVGRVPQRWMVSQSAKAAFVERVIVPLVRAGAVRLVGLTASSNIVNEGTPLRDEIERRRKATGRMPWWHEVAQETGLPGLEEHALASVLAPDRVELHEARITRFQDAPPLIGKFRRADDGYHLGGAWVDPVVAALKEVQGV